MACADVLRLAGVDISGVSLSSMVRLALNVLIETAIKDGRVPRRDGFEYEQLLMPYKRSNIKTKVQVGQVLAHADKLRQGADMTMALGTLPGGELTDEGSKAAAKLRQQLSAEREAHGAHSAYKRDPRSLRRDELKFRSEQDPANMSAAEFRELRKLQKELAHA